MNSTVHINEDCRNKESRNHENDARPRRCARASHSMPMLGREWFRLAVIGLTLSHYAAIAGAHVAIRLFEVTSAQAAAAHALDAACFPPNGLWSEAQLSEELQNPRCTAIGAWISCGSDSGHAEFLAGMAFTDTVLDETALTTLAVHPEKRRQGLAEVLLREAMALATTAGSTRFTLEVRESNKAALALYAKCGLACVGRRKRYYRHPNEDALIYDSMQLGDNLGHSMVDAV